jgi:hypothetical protein
VRALGLRYGLVTPETALVAVGAEVVARGGVSTSVAVPVALPAGMKWQAVFGAGGDAADTARRDGRGKESPTAPAEKSEHGAVSVTSKPSDATVAKTPPAGQPSAGATAGAAHEDVITQGEASGGESVEVAGRAPVVDVEEERTSEVVMLAPGTYGARRWRFAFELGAGALVAPDRSVLGFASTRVERGLTSTLGVGLDVTVLVAPSADDRVAVALMGALLRGGLFGDRLAIELGVGPEIAKDPGLGYALAAHLGGRIGLVLRWDGAILAGPDGAVSRGSATAGLHVDF